MKIKVLFSTILYVLVGLFIVACSGGGGGGSAANTALRVSTAEFIDSAVAGLNYRYLSSGQTGVTDDQGKFPYISGDTIEFSVGNIVLGQRASSLMMSPLNLVNATVVTDQRVTNIARFLQILDDDIDPSNGIIITQNVRDIAAVETASIDFNQTATAFENDGVVQIVVASFTAANGTARMLTDITIAAAQDHLNATLQAAINGTLGTYSGTAENHFIGTCPSNAIGTVSSGTWTVTNVNGMNYDGSGSFSVVVQGITVRQDFTYTGTLSFDGTFTGNAQISSYQNGEFAGGGSSSFTGEFNGEYHKYKFPSQNVGGGCQTSGASVIVRRAG